jgi:hypothetical protein
MKKIGLKNVKYAGLDAVFFELAKVNTLDTTHFDDPSVDLIIYILLKKKAGKIISRHQCQLMVTSQKLIV